MKKVSLLLAAVLVVVTVAVVACNSSSSDKGPGGISELPQPLTQHLSEPAPERVPVASTDETCRAAIRRLIEESRSAANG